MNHRRNLSGKRIQSARRQREPKLSQNDLARELQVLGFRIERSAIAKIESGTRPVNDLELAAIASILGVSVAWLLEVTD